MDVTKHDGIMYLYNVAVVITGGYAVLRMNIESKWPMFGLAFMFAIVWTVYFRYAMIPRLADHPRFAAEADDSAFSMPPDDSEPE